MADAKVEMYKKAIAKMVDTWGKDVEKLATQIDKFFADFRGQLYTHRDAIYAKQRVLNEQIKKVKVPDGADEKEILTWFSEVVGKKLKMFENWIKITPDTSTDSGHLWMGEWSGNWKTIPFRDV